MWKRAITTILILALLVGGASFAYKKIKASTGPEKTQYRVVPIAKGLVKKTVTATGVLKSWKTVDIKSRAGGRVEKIAVEEGQLVKQGDPYSGQLRNRHRRPRKRRLDEPDAPLFSIESRTTKMAHAVNARHD